ncbi:hypothetical protein VTJ49DRAFT_2094 [Mycothermus thermophilus]|uniref:Uncharacterized protein n=1 Tax=Humicola insolens TaxID=85995 RepID=A0ABR3VB74_HUMIN
MSSLGNHSGNQSSHTGLEYNESAMADDLLTSRITVKGLTNLASYPNPMQKAAQNTLARARTVDLGLGRPDTPSSSQSTTPDLTKGRNLNPYGPPRAPTGPPEPLKAGPPGHRPFKPSALDLATKRTLVEDQLPMPPHQPRLPADSLFSCDASMAPSPGPRGWDPASHRPAQTSLSEKQGSAVLRSAPGSAGPIRLATPVPVDASAQAEDGSKRKVYDTLPVERIKPYYPAGFPSNYDGRYKPVPEDWHARYPLSEDGLETSSDRLSRIDQNFYGGAARLMRTAEQVARDCSPRCSRNKAGVIGEERERMRGSLLDRQNVDIKLQHPFMSVEEVNKMAQAEIIEPLLNMTLATLLGYKKDASGVRAQNPWADRFVKAEADWIDSSDEGNKSLFRDEAASQKKVPRMTRLGY